MGSHLTPRIDWPYRWALKAFPRSYLEAHGDELLGTLQDVHESDSPPSVAECLGLVGAGFTRRLAAVRHDPVTAVMATAVTLETGLFLTLISDTIRLAVRQPQSSWPVTAIFDRIAVHQNIGLLSGFLAVLVLLTGLFATSSVSLWRNVDRRERAKRRLVERAVTMGQPFLLAMVGFVVACLFDINHAQQTVAADVGTKVGACILGGFLLGAAITFPTVTAGWWKRVNRFPIVATMLCIVGLSMSGFVLAGVRFGGSEKWLDSYSWRPALPSFVPFVPADVPSGVGANIGDGFRSLVPEPTGRVLPVSASCNQASCEVLGLSSPAGASVLGEMTRDGWRFSPSRVSYPLGEALTCPTATVCYVVSGNSGRVYRTVDGGRHWFGYAIGAGADVSFSSLACVSAQQCVLATTTGVYETSNSGSSWRETLHLRTPARSDSYLLGLTCVGGYFCGVADMTTIFGSGAGSMVRTTFAVSRDGGGTWSLRTLAPLTRSLFGPNLHPSLDSFQCVSSRQCLYVGPSLGLRPTEIVTLDGGRTWRTLKLPAALISPNDSVVVRCFASSCWLVPQSPAFLWKSNDGGLSWVRVDLPHGLALGMRLDSGEQGRQDGLGTIACRSSLDCIALAARNSARGPSRIDVFLTTTDGGRHWLVHPLPVEPPEARI